ncbi:MAG: glycoside hydrolase family 16 protein [Litorimonas sp.]
MRYTRIAGVVMAFALSACSTAETLSSQSKGSLSDRGWDLVWADEFDGDALDRTKWAPEVSCWGGGNNEQQCYVDRPENVSVEGGYLSLYARPGAWTGPGVHMEHSDYPGASKTKPYTSGKVRTRDLASWRYGRIEGRMKLPTGQGAWPAFWMMPQFYVHGGWPLSGEIDIMEAVNLGASCFDCDDGDVENRSSGAIHFGKRPPNNTHISQRRPLTSVARQDDLPRNQFHTFAVEWGEGRMDWFVDGERFWTAKADDWFTDAVRKPDNPNAPFDEEFYVMLNFAVGGNWPEGDNEKGVDPAAFPAALVVDYVRVYQCASDPETGRACLFDD